MSVWATRRKFIYTGSFFLFIILAVGIPAVVILYNPAMCDDGKKNGDERGVDCGGSCRALCPADALAPTILWQRAFKVTDGVYNAVALIENPNLEWGTKKSAYQFKLFDAKGLVIAERTGTTDISAHQTFPIFEQTIRAGNRVPTRVVFEFTSQLDWRKTQDRSSNVKVISQLLSNPTTAPRLEARVENKTEVELPNIEIVAILFDQQNNAMAASRTYIENFLPAEKRSVVFTWPLPFGGPVARVNIIPKIPDR